MGRYKCRFAGHTLIDRGHVSQDAGQFEAVCARGWNHDGETWLNKHVASVDYKVINGIANEIPSNTGDFQLMSRCVVEELRYLWESDGFLRGFVALVVFKQAYVQYARAARFSRKGNHNRLVGSLTIGLDGAIGLTVRSRRSPDNCSV